MVSAEFLGTSTGKKPASYSVGRPYGNCIWIVIHTTEGGEGATAAEDGNAYDARRTDGTSTHVFADSDSVVQEVNSADRSHAARTIANNRGYQVELCGKAAQTALAWADGNSSKELVNAAKHCAHVAHKLGIPLKWLTQAEVLARKPGFITHKNVTDWLEGTHVDPGAGFPFTVFMNLVKTWDAKYYGQVPVPAKVETDLVGDQMKLFLVKGAPKVGSEARYKTDGLKAWHLRTMAEVVQLEKLFGKTVVLDAWPESVAIVAEGESGLRAMNAVAPVPIDDTQMDSPELDGEHDGR